TEQSVPGIIQDLNAAYNAYAYALEDMFPKSQFPHGPFANQNFFHVGRDIESNPFTIQHLFDLVYDLVQSHNEVLDTAFPLRGHCCLNPQVFPRHVFVGEPLSGKIVSPVRPGPRTDPSQINFLAGAAIKPRTYRHHFIPSPLFNRGNERIQKIRSLFYRTWLLIYRYSTGNLMSGNIRITPSRTGPAVLSEKAVPYYYAFQPTDDLHRNWAYIKSVTNQLSDVHSYQFTNPADHPLKYRLESHNFLRIEGILGKRLGQCLTDLTSQKKLYGLNFAIEPVFMPLDDEKSPNTKFSLASISGNARNGLMKMYFCKFKDLDSIFMVLVVSLFQYFSHLLVLLNKVNPTDLILKIPQVPPISTKPPPTSPLPDFGGFTWGKAYTSRDKSIVRNLSNTQFGRKRFKVYSKGNMTNSLSSGKKAKESFGALMSKAYKLSPGIDNPTDVLIKALPTFGFTGKIADQEMKLRPTALLIDSIETLMKTTSVKSIVDFDFNAFEIQLDGFKTAADRYLDQDQGARTKGSPSQIQAEVAENLRFLATSGSTDLLSNVAHEFRKRLQKVFAEYELKTYSRKHPGMQHQCGVPEGGTLILLYTHVDNLPPNRPSRPRGRVGTTIKNMKAFSASVETRL
ncbi:MAG: hypothetical protein GWN61_02520, partial [candidate division Zixibacteria bacterium]|nr:hypothetical protein [candidate division KSB1 bacterium]NIV05085.1 hypothetical protein [candidate division Zixibacteria bacterium]NIS23137.1 hypothetical protein [candidate division KSB1 bacterium]NIT69999.1 hypothetical protein [candidate division KSB1 bacterium]NIU23634.1 hypothetical protein [candidate division KSB1 bacterium]